MFRIIVTCALLAMAVACSRSKHDDAADGGFFLDDGHSLASDADADTYTGPAPLTVTFSAHAINASGRPGYHWTFDDRTTSEAQRPVHTFARQGWYRVVMDARDETGSADRTTLLLHVWRPRDWARMQTKRDMRIVMRSLRELQRKSNAEEAAATAHD